MGRRGVGFYATSFRAIKKGNASYSPSAYGIRDLADGIE